MIKIIKWFLFAFLVFACFNTEAQAQVSAASCSQSDVQNAINSASAGQTVNVPAGSCSWTSVNLAKAITLSGAGQGVTNITLTVNPSFSIMKQTGGTTRIKNLTFIGTNANVFPHFISVSGPWPNGQPVIFQNVAFNANSGTMVAVLSPGGVIFSHIAFTGAWDNALVTIKDTGTTSWTTADTMGSKDTTGFANVYIEDSTFVGGSNGVTDCDDSCRMVVRHNVFGANGKDSGGPNSHGRDTSPQGMRHFEIYSNSFLFPDKTCSNGGTSLSNINQWIWIRGGTGVIYNNNFDSLYSSCWGDKVEWKFAIRGAEDVRPAGTCSATSYPVSHQLGQNNNGNSDFIDPIYVWGNISNDTLNPILRIAANSGWQWGNPCGFNWNNYFQWGRDAIDTSVGSVLLTTAGGSVDAIGGTGKPGYAAYAYPHPLISGQTSATSPVAPSGLTATVQ